MTYTIEKVTTLIGARRYGDNDTNIGFILTDSRSLCERLSVRIKPMLVSLSP